MGISVELKGAWAKGEEKENPMYVISPNGRTAVIEATERIGIQVSCKKTDDGGRVLIYDNSLRINHPHSGGYFYVVMPILKA